jgi:hypothetical protein
MNHILQKIQAMFGFPPLHFLNRIIYLQTLFRNAVFAMLQPYWHKRNAMIYESDQ